MKYRLHLLLASLLICASLLFAGCATTSPTSPPTAADTPQIRAGKSLLAAKSAIVVAATSIDSLCNAGTLTPAVCTQAKATYGQTKPAYDAAVDAYLLMQSVGGDPGNFAGTLSRLQSLANNLAAVLPPKGGAQ